MSTFSEAVQRAQQLSAGFTWGTATLPPVNPANLKEDDYRLQPRRGLFNCQRCGVGEMNPPEAIDHFTAWPCWFCGQDDMTIPRPIPVAEPADDAMTPRNDISQTSLT
jgi:hypothetical protein